MVKTQKSKSSTTKKATITKNNKNKQKEIKYNEEFIEEFKKVYTTIIYNMCVVHTFHDDSCCYMEGYGSREVYSDFKYFTIIYQPTLDNFIIDIANMMIIIKNHNITASDKKQMKIEKEKLEQILVKDFKEFLQIIDNKWFRPIQELNFNNIMEIIEPFKFIKKNTFKIKFKPFYCGQCGGWNPNKISQLLNIKVDDSYNQRFKEFNFSHNIEY